MYSQTMLSKYDLDLVAIGYQFIKYGCLCELHMAIKCYNTLELLYKIMIDYEKTVLYFQYSIFVS